MNLPIHTKRIDIIDVLRGFALLGIVIMNIQAFAMPSQAYFNPFAFGAEGASIFDSNGVAYMITHLIADQKFMTMFSLLFGISIALVVESHKNSGKNVSSIRFLLRRHVLLLFIGLTHAYFIWEGDILVSYALCGFFIIWFRNKSAKYLIILGSILFSFPIVFLLLIGLLVPEALLVPELQDEWVISEKALANLSATLTGNWLQQLDYRIPAAFEMQTSLFIIYTFWRVSSLMLWGMAIYKLGLFHEKVSSARMGRWSLLFVLLGLIIIALGIHQNNAHQWEAFYSNFFGNQFNYIGSIVLAMGYIFGFVALGSRLPFLVRYSFQCIGKMALTNYLLQSIICSYIFYGHGLGLFSKLDRFEVLSILPLIWLFQIMCSIFWLRYFRQGPIEWLWRCAVASSIMPIRR